ncbi:MAG: alpha/beta fold hydrolase [Proteobacteria bacterium]|nr:alpha/beta fold hydrolase [Pseudomonadota bacterium]
MRILIAAACVLSTVCASSGVHATPPTLQVGTVLLTRCDPGQGGYCGSIERPLDPTNPDSELITVGFEFYPHTDTSHPSVGTLLPQEGGPGYSTTGSGDFYLSIFGPLRKTRDVVIIDKRGTGTSDALDCPQLQAGTGDFQKAVAACARQLGANAYQYGTVLAAGDVAAVLDALGIGQVDFYGDSYGTFFGQVFAALYPQRLRSIVLDSAYPVRPPDVWFGTDWKTAWAGIDLSCSRSLSCSNLGGSASGRVRSLIAQIRQTPIQGTAPDANGTATAITLDAPTLLYTLDTAGYGPVIYRDLDAATRAWQQHGDPLPLLRLAAEAETAEVDAPADFSDALYTAVSCQDYPLLYDLRASKAQRTLQYQDALEDTSLKRPDLFAPFSFAEGMASQAYITPLDTCLNWPRPPAAVVPGQPLPPAVSFPSVPTLVLSGDLDSVTSPEDAAETTQQFPDAVHLIIPNLPHVTAGSDDLGCVTRILRTFVRTLTPGDTSCIPPGAPDPHGSAVRRQQRRARAHLTADGQPRLDRGTAGGGRGTRERRRRHRALVLFRHRRRRASRRHLQDPLNQRGI